MSTHAPAPFWPQVSASGQKAERSQPARPTPHNGPVFIYDSILPAGHSTLLHQLWRRWDEERSKTD